MTGLSNYSAQNLLNYLVGAASMPALPASEWLALFTAVGNDSGSGMAEPGSGTGYQRTQIAGSLLTTSGTASGSPILNIAALPAWVQVGMLVTDTTTPASIPVSSYVIAKTSGSVTLSNILPNLASGDSIRFTSFGPAVTGATYSLVNGAPITFPQAAVPGYTCPAFGIFDASGGGNMLTWDFFGLYNWGPFSSASGASGSGAVFRQVGHGFSNGDGVIVSPEFGGTLPTTTQGTLSGYALNYAANVLGDSYTLSSSSGAPASGNAVWTSNAGGGQARKVTPVVVPPGVQETIPPGNLYLSTYVTPPATLPLNIAPGAAAAYSYRQLGTSYAGYAAKIQNQFITMDIGFVAGNFDEATYRTFVAAAPADGFTNQWYDQSGNGNHMIGQAQPYMPRTFSLAFDVGPGGAHGFGAACSPTNASGGWAMTCPDAPSIQNIWATGGFAVIVFLVEQGGAGPLMSKGSSAGWQIFPYQVSPANSLYQLLLYLQASGGAGYTWISNQVTMTPVHHVLTVAWNASTPSVPATITLDGVVCSLNATATPSGTFANDVGSSLVLYNDSGTINAALTNSFGGAIFEVMLWKGANVPSPAQQTALINNIKAFYPITTLPPTPLLDVVSGAVAAYSLRKLRTAYAGNANTVWRASDNTPFTIGFISNGMYDGNALATSTYPSGARTNRWYDQSGNGNDVVNAVSGTSQPVVELIVDFWGVKGLPGQNQILTAPSGASINNMFASGGSIYMVVNIAEVPAGAAILCGKGTASWAFYVQPAGDVHLWFAQKGATTQGSWSASTATGIQNRHIVEVQYDNRSGSNQPVFATDGVISPIGSSTNYTGAVVSDSDSGLQLMQGQLISLSNAWDGWILEAIFFNRILSPTERTTLINNLKVFYGMPS